MAFRPGSSSERLRILQSWDQCRDDGLFVTIEVPNSPFCGQIVQVSHFCPYRPQKRLTLAGNIVISVGLFGHSGDDEVWTEGTKEMLDDMHKRKIDMADGIYVINVGGYIGQSTRSEIEYARSQGKSVEFL